MRLNMWASVSIHNRRQVSRAFAGGSDFDFVDHFFWGGFSATAVRGLSLPISRPLPAWCPMVRGVLGEEA